jgi:putative salt-induced outer membrane protein YdiY
MIFFFLLFGSPGISWGNPWEGSVNLGLTATDGNSQVSTTTVSVQAEKKESAYIFQAGASTAYGRTEGETTTEKSNANAVYNHFLTERLTGSINFAVDVDRIADLLYRIQIGPGLGYFFVKTEKASLSANVGVNYFREKYEDIPADDYYAARFAERGEYRISETAKVWEAVEYLPALDDFNDKYLLKGEAGVEASMTAKTHIRLLVQDTYNNIPAPGRQPNDITYIAALGFKF